MATCPECDAEIEVDEFDVDKGDLVSCPDCGSNLEVTSIAPVELETVDDVYEDEDDLEDDGVDEDEDEDDEDEDEEVDETSGDWDEGSRPSTPGLTAPPRPATSCSRRRRSPVRCAPSRR